MGQTTRVIISGTVMGHHPVLQWYL